MEKVGAHVPIWENLWAKGGPNRVSIGSLEKRIMLDCQLTVLLVKVVRTTFFEHLQSVWDVHVMIHVAPPSVLPIRQHKIGIMLFFALCRLFVLKS